MSKSTEISFSPVTMEEWEKLSVKTLKSGSFDELITETFENIKLLPLYTSQNSERLEGADVPPGIAPFLRGVQNPSEQARPWKVAQWLTRQNSRTLLEQIASLESKGQDVISFQSAKFREEDLTQWLDSMDSNPIKDILVELDENHVQWLITQGWNKNLKGFIGFDPIKIMLEKQSSTENLSTYYDVLTKAAKQVPKEMKTILIDSTIYHNSGADMVTELASILASAVEHIEQLEQRGLPSENILNRFLVRIGVGGNFFLEVAKVRALRYLWYKLTSAYNIKSEESKKISIAAETSMVTKTIFDEYVNVLRAGNEAFAAVVAGVDYLHITPFDVCLKDKKELADRIARNTHHLLAEESYLSHALDPAGGSWYMESLTKELAEKAWELFLTIENKQGLLACIESGWLQECIQKSREEKINAVKTRKLEIVGTNVFVDGNDRKPTEILNAGHNLVHFPSYRLSQSFEKWRLYFNQNPAKVALIGLGTLKEYKDRRDMARNWFASVGVMTEMVDGLEAIKSEDYKAVCLCGTDDSYQSWNQSYTTPLFAAGKPMSHEIIKSWIYPERPVEEVVETWVSKGGNE